MRALQTLILAAALLLGLASCVAPYTPWPEEGGGGLAETYAPFDRELEDLTRRHSALRDVNAEERQPARMLDVQRLIVRAHRERAGGLLRDAHRTIEEASELLASLEAKFGIAPRKAGA